MSPETKHEILKAAALAIKDKLPAGFGFVLVIGPVNQELPNGGDYVSDLQPEGAMEFLTDTVRRVKANIVKGKHLPPASRN